MYQKDNPNFKKYEWNTYNEVGVILFALFFIFVAIAYRLVPSFYEAIQDGWHLTYRHRRSVPGEIWYAVWAFVSLSMMSFPHIYKSSTMPIYPSGLQYWSRYDTTGARILGGIMCILLIIFTIAVAN